MFLQETDLNVVPGGIIPVMHVSQYDVGRELKFVLYSGYDYASLESGTTVTIEGTKPDGHGFQYSGVLDQNAHTATFVTTEQMTVLAGAIECKLTLSLNSQRIGTALFILDVEKAGITDSTIISDTELPLIIAQATEQMERAEAAADAAALSETNAATSETNAATSETNAANSEIICGSFMRMAGASAASAEQSAIISGSFMRTAGNYADEAEASATSANVNALKSEGHALGTQNGTPVSSDSPYYHNNAKYWADEARQSSAGGVAASVIATAEPTNISSHAYAIGEQFVYNGVLYKATSPISIGSTIVPGTNCTIADNLVYQIGEKQNIVLASTMTIGGQTVTEVEEALGSLANISKPMTGATSSAAGEGGFVPSPSAGDENKALFGDGTWKPVSGGGGGGHTILDEDGITYPQRSKLQFEGCEVTDDAVNGVTVVKCEGGGTVIVDVPTVTNTELIYDGTAKSPTITRDTAHTTITGTTEATEFGSYTFTISLSDPTYYWSDFTKVPKTYTWGVGYDGSTITPVNDIQTWLKCAMITDKSYTTLSEVLNDHETLYQLFGNENATDYLVRSTSWVSDITADQTAMDYIGRWNYCADTLLADSTWRTAICDSTYFESVLNVKVPTMTSNTAPSGVCSCSSVHGNRADMQAYKSVDGLEGGTNFPCAISGSDANPWWQYQFPSAVKCHRVIAKEHGDNYQIVTQSFWESAKIQGSNDGSTWTDVSTIGGTISLGVQYDSNFANNTDYKYYRLAFTSWGTSATTYKEVGELQFYGRSDVTENQIDIYSAASDTVYYLDNGSPVTVCTTDAAGHASIDRTTLPNGTYTLYSSVAKDPDNLSNNYSKSVTVSDGTAEIKVMPDGALYWWGNKCEWITGGWDNPGDYTKSNRRGGQTFNSNSITLNMPSSDGDNVCGTTNSIAKGTNTSLNWIWTKTAIAKGNMSIPNTTYYFSVFSQRYQGSYWQNMFEANATKAYHGTVGYSDHGANPITATLHAVYAE